VYCRRNDLQVEKGSDISAVVYHNGQWHRLGHSNQRNCPTVGPSFPEAGIHDIIENLPSYQPRTNTPMLDLGDLTLALPDPNIKLAPQVQQEESQKPPEEHLEEDSEDESETSEESIDQEIRNSPIVIPKPLHPTSAQIKPVTMATETLYTTHTMEQPHEEGLSQIGTAISMSQAQQIHQSLQQSMRQTGPLGWDPGGGGGNGNGGHGRPLGGGPPDDRDEDPQNNQAAGGQPAGQPDTKPIGELPSVFTGDRELVEQFLDELEGYFLLDCAMLRFNGGGNKTALALMLI
jgi:hypothetical protein